MKTIAVINFVFSGLCFLVGVVSFLSTRIFILSPWAFCLFAFSFGMICLAVRDNSTKLNELETMSRDIRKLVNNLMDDQLSQDEQAITDGLIAPYKETADSEIATFLDSSS